MCLREHFSSNLVDTPVKTVWLFCTLNTNISKVWNLCLQNQKHFQYWQYTTSVNLYMWQSSSVTSVWDYFMNWHNAMDVRYMWNINEFCVHLSSLTCVSSYIFKYFSSQNILAEVILSSCIYNNECLVCTKKKPYKIWVSSWAGIMFILSKGFGFAK